MRAIEGQRVCSIHEAAPLSNAPGADFVQPDRPQDREQPTVEPRAGFELVRALDRAYAGPLDEIVSGVARARQHERIAPQALQTRLKSLPHLPSAGFGHARIRTRRG